MPHFDVPEETHIRDDGLCRLDGRSVLHNPEYPLCIGGNQIRSIEHNVAQIMDIRYVGQHCSRFEDTFGPKKHDEPKTGMVMALNKNLTLVPGVAEYPDRVSIRLVGFTVRLRDCR